MSESGGFLRVYLLKGISFTLNLAYSILVSLNNFLVKLLSFEDSFHEALPAPPE